MYKVKVVDTAGYVSEFSSAIMAKTEPANVLPSNNFITVPAKQNLNLVTPLSVESEEQGVVNMASSANKRSIWKESAALKLCKPGKEP